ncbi:MAG: hypothetical protein H0V89_08850 [Deltaproteobacteria bacterium]|nr:hypothetical protein [Deltaproteobacteria bacterium]
MWSLVASFALAAPCGTLALMPYANPLRVPPFAGAAPPAGELALRDVFGVPNVETSEHFALRWGDGAAVTTAQVGRLLDSFEAAWSHQVEYMGHPAPLGSDVYKFNVYIGDTGEGTPESLGAAGYYWTDDEGAPMVVIAASLLVYEDSTDATALHEFYHAIQGSLNRFPYDGLGAWFWEATAEWAAIQTHPFNADMGSLLFGYLLLPHLPVNSFDYPDSGTLAEYHQYGAFLFPHYLTTEVVGFELVRDAWVVPGEDGDPIEVMRAWLAADGIDLDDAWLDHIAANAAYDYPLGEVWAASVDAMAEYVDGEHPLTATFSGAGRHEPHRVEDRDTAPGRYGYNVLVLASPISGDVEVEIVGDAVGDEGSPAHFGARVIHLDDGIPTYYPVAFDGLVGTAVVPVDRADEIRVVVGAWTPETAHWTDEVFPYEVTMGIGEAPAETSDGVAIGGIPEEEVVPSICGTATPMAGWLALPLLAWTRRRSR